MRSANTTSFGEKSARPRMNKAVESGLFYLVEVLEASKLPLPDEADVILEPLMEYIDRLYVYRDGKGLDNTTTEPHSNYVFEELQRWVGKQLKEAREAAGFSQARLASQLGMSRRSLRRYEEGLRLPRLPRLVQWCLLCETAVSILFTGVESALLEARGQDIQMRIKERTYDLST